MMSGSVPPRPSVIEHPQPPLGSADHTDDVKPESNAPQARVPVYGTKETLERLLSAYGGGLWPELGHWASTEEESGGRAKRRRLVKPKTTDGCGVVLTPYANTFFLLSAVIEELKLTWIQSPPVERTPTFESITPHHHPHVSRRSWVYLPRTIRIISHLCAIRPSSHTKSQWE
jgi:hypothetical protein